MKTYIVQNNDKNPGVLSNEDTKEFHREHLFRPLAVLSESLQGEMLVVNEMELIGVAVVEASDSAVETLKRAGYSVSINSTKRAT